MEVGSRKVEIARPPGPVPQGQAGCAARAGGDWKLSAPALLDQLDDALLVAIANHHINAQGCCLDWLQLSIAAGDDQGRTGMGSLQPPRLLA